MTHTTRTQAYKRKPQQEKVLQEVNDLLEIAERQVLVNSLEGPEMPIVLIVGPPHSATTLILQWLASSGAFAYPTNLLSRFFKAPYIGSRIQQLLTDPEFDYKGELSDFAGEMSEWTSDVGKTRGALQPHEFYYFWRRFFPIDQAQKLTKEHLQDSDPDAFTREWGLIERAFGKPIVAKGIPLQYDLLRVAEWLPTAIFIHTHREPFFNIQSLLQSRKRVFGTYDTWFSVQPPEYEWLQNEDPFIQVAGQVLFTNQAIDAAFRKLPAHRALRLNYEDFCQNPSDMWENLNEAMAEMGHPMEPYDGPHKFTSTNDVRCSKAESRRIRDAYQKLAIQVD